MLENLIVLDTPDRSARQNRCFDPYREYIGAGYYIGVRLAREARRRLMDIVTSDVYLETKKHPNKAACVTEMVTPFTDKLLLGGTIPSICMSLESPLNNKKYYHNVKHYAGRFHHSYQFRGIKDRLLGTDTIFHPIVFPMDTKNPLPLRPWTKRKYLVLVNSNKRSVYQNWRNCKECARSIVARVRAMYYYTVDPWMRIREGYRDRVEAIKYFASQSELELYGFGWDQPIRGYEKDYHHAALKAYKGTILGGLRGKRDIISRYKFALCFENCVFPGYVTEKIFDCFLAGCIPVYYGAPDVSDFIPRECFIDLRQFEDFPMLDSFLSEMTEGQAKCYIDAATDFLSSATFEKFTADYFVNDVLNVIEEELQSK